VRLVASAAVPSPAAATTATTAAIAPAAAATAATAAATLFPWASFVDRQAATVYFLQVQCLNGCLSLSVVGHFDETEALAAARVAVLNDRRIFHLAKLGKELFQALAGDTVSQVSNILSRSH